MDITCHQCGEPWEIDSLHDQVDKEEGRAKGNPVPGFGLVFRTYAQARDAFHKLGCELFGQSHGPLLDQERMGTIAELQALSGGDVEFEASMMEDAQRFGLI